LQQGLLSHALDARPGVYLLQMVGELREPIDAGALRHAWQRAADRHEILRTGFHWDRPGEPFQQVHARVEIPFQEHDWRGRPPADQARALEEWLEADRRLGFDPARPPLLRVVLFRLGDADCRLVYTFHHAILDGRANHR